MSDYDRTKVAAGGSLLDTMVAYFQRVAVAAVAKLPPRLDRKPTAVTVIDPQTVMVSGKGYSEKGLTIDTEWSISVSVSQKPRHYEVFLYLRSTDGLRHNRVRLDIGWDNSVDAAVRQILQVFAQHGI